MATPDVQIINAAVGYDRTHETYYCRRCGQSGFASQAAATGHQKAHRGDDDDADGASPPSKPPSTAAGGQGGSPGAGVSPPSPSPMAIARAGATATDGRGTSGQSGPNPAIAEVHAVRQELAELREAVEKMGNHEPHLQADRQRRQAVPWWATVALGAVGGAVFGWFVGPDCRGDEDTASCRKDLAVSAVRWSVGAAAVVGLLTAGGESRPRRQLLKETGAAALTSFWS